MLHAKLNTTYVERQRHAKALFTVAVFVNALPPKIMAECSVSTTMKPPSASDESPKLLRSAGLQANMALLVM